MSNERARLFVAVEIPQSVRDAVDVATEEIRRRQPELKWTSLSSFHVTLAFLGWVDLDAIPVVDRATAQAAAESEPFTVRLSGEAGTFGSKVLWAGIEESEPLRALAESVRSNLSAEGFPIESRPFHAHLTLARGRQDTRVRRELAASYDGPRDSWKVDQVVVMRSRLSRSGARYTVQSAWPLGEEHQLAGPDEPGA